MAGEDKKLIFIPRGLPERPPLSFDMTDIYRVENRLPEVAHVSPMTMPSLSSDLTVAYGQASKCLAAICYELMEAEKHKDEIESRLLIDEYAGFLTKTKLNDNGSTRNAFLVNNKDFSISIDKINALRALKMLLEGKVRTFDKAQQTCKKIAELKSGRGGFNGYGNHGNEGD